MEAKEKANEPRKRDIFQVITAAATTASHRHHHYHYSLHPSIQDAEEYYGNAVRQQRIPAADYIIMIFKTLWTQVYLHVYQYINRI